MAISGGVRSNQLFIGLSIDPKPGDAEFAAQFYEYDTGKTYIFTGDNRIAPDQGQWVEYLGLPTIPLNDPAIITS